MILYKNDEFCWSNGKYLKYNIILKVKYIIYKKYNNYY